LREDRRNLQRQDVAQGLYTFKRYKVYAIGWSDGQFLVVLFAIIFETFELEADNIRPPYLFTYSFIYFSTDIDNTSNTNKNNKMPAKDRKAPEGTLTSTLINTI